MRPRVIVIGAGMGGLAAAARLALHGYGVLVLEARREPGGLASDLLRSGLRLDAGPYILLDRPGLDWAFEALKMSLGAEVELRRIDDVYEVATGAGSRVRIYASAERTAQGLERSWPGSARRYLDFVRRSSAIQERLRPLSLVARPGAAALWASGAWRDLRFLRRSLAAVLEASRLPAPVQEALGVWTHAAGPSRAQAQSPLALVPALIHGLGGGGAFYPRGGLGVLPRLLAARARELGVEIRMRTRVRRIVVADAAVRGVETESGEHLPCTAVVSNASGVGTYLDLVEKLPSAATRRLRELPLQSPGVSAYLRVEGAPRPPYLRFWIPEPGSAPRLLVEPRVVEPELGEGTLGPARLIVPVDQALAERLGESGQRAHLERLLAEDWWQQGYVRADVVETRVPADWGREYGLHRDAMSPLLTTRFLRQGRLRHRSPWVRGLYLAGSATHPGPWLGSCAVSGIHAADLLHADSRGR